MKKILALFIVFFASTAISRAQITFDDFSSTPSGYEFGSWTAATSASSGVFTVASPADNSGSYLYAAPITTGPFNFTSLNITQVTVTARIDVGNAAQGFLITFFDSAYNGALAGTFSTASFSSGFTTQTVTLNVYAGGGSASDISYYGIAGSGTTDAFRVSFDSIAVSAAAVPEPTTYAGIFGLLALGFAAWRRRKVQA